MKQSIRVLKKELTNSSENSFLAKKCNEISRAYMYRDLDQVKKYASLALNYAKIASLEIEQSKAYMNLGAYAFLCQDFETGIKNYAKARDLASNDPITIVRIYMGIGICFTQINCYEQALYYEEQALQLATKASLNPEKAAIYNNIGRIYSELGDYELSKNYYLRGYQIAKEHHYIIIKGYLLVGIVQNDLKFNHLSEVEQYLLKLDNLIDQHNEMWYMGIAKCLWGSYYAASDAIEYARECFNTGIEIIEEEEQFYYVTLAYLNYSTILARLGYEYETKVTLDRYKLTLDHLGVEVALPKYFAHVAELYASQIDVKQYNQYQSLYLKYKDQFEKIINEYF